MREGPGRLRSEATVALCCDGCRAETVQPSLVAERKGPHSTETGVVFLREACEAKRSPVQRKGGNHLNWLMVFGQEPPSVALRSFYADIFEIEAQAERELQLKAKSERMLE